MTIAALRDYLRNTLIPDTKLTQPEDPAKVYAGHHKQFDEDLLNYLDGQDFPVIYGEFPEPPILKRIFDAGRRCIWVEGQLAGANVGRDEILIRAASAGIKSADHETDLPTVNTAATQVRLPAWCVLRIEHATPTTATIVVEHSVEQQVEALIPNVNELTQAQIEDVIDDLGVLTLNAAGNLIVDSEFAFDNLNTEQYLDLLNDREGANPHASLTGNPTRLPAEARAGAVTTLEFDAAAIAQHLEQGIEGYVRVWSGPTASKAHDDAHLLMDWHPLDIDGAEEHIQVLLTNADHYIWLEWKVEDGFLELPVARLTVGMTVTNAKVHKKGIIRPDLDKAIDARVNSKLADFRTRMGAVEARLTPLEVEAAASKKVTDELGERIQTMKDVSIRTIVNGEGPYYLAPEDGQDGFPQPIAAGAALIGVPAETLEDAGTSVTVNIWQGNDPSAGTMTKLTRADVAASTPTVWTLRIADVPANSSVSVWANGTLSVNRIKQQIMDLQTAIANIQGTLNSEVLREILRGALEHSDVVTWSFSELNAHFGEVFGGANNAFAVAGFAPYIIITDAFRNAVADVKTKFFAVGTESDAYRVFEGKVQVEVNKPAKAAVMATRRKILYTSAGFHRIRVNFAGDTDGSFTTGLPANNEAVTMLLEGYVNWQDDLAANANLELALPYHQGNLVTGNLIVDSNNFDTGVDYAVRWRNSAGNPDTVPPYNEIEYQIDTANANFAVHQSHGFVSGHYDEVYEAQAADPGGVRWVDVRDARAGDNLATTIVGYDCSGATVVVIGDDFTVDTLVPVTNNIKRAILAGTLTHTGWWINSNDARLDEEVIRALREHSTETALGLYTRTTNHNTVLNLLCGLMVKNPDGSDWRVQNPLVWTYILDAVYGGDAVVVVGADYVIDGAHLPLDKTELEVVFSRSGNENIRATELVDLTPLRAAARTGQEIHGHAGGSFSVHSALSTGGDLISVTLKKVGINDIKLYQVAVR